MKDKMKTGLIAAVTAALLALTITFVMAGGIGRSGGNGGETVLQVSNLSCGACLKTIEGELRKNKGMLGMTADLATGLVTIKHTAELSPERLAELVSSAGYPAKVAAPSTATNQATAGGLPGCRGCGPKGCNLPPPTPSKS
ncbi:MAG TPA: heavy metal-associated domain-containing protein [Desulfurivibrionaceae bacterium]|nr:heavy metal-associated domain-containing protein [Desulfurivibrionaceae bacterium]